MEAQARVRGAFAPAVEASPRPKHNGTDGEQPAEQQPIASEPVPGQAVRSVAEEVRIGDVRRQAESNQVSGNVERPPDEYIGDQEGDVDEVADVFVGRESMNKKGQSAEKEKEGAVTQD